MERRYTKIIIGLLTLGTLACSSTYGAATVATIPPMPLGMPRTNLVGAVAQGRTFLDPISAPTTPAITLPICDLEKEKVQIQKELKGWEDMRDTYNHK